MPARSRPREKPPIPLKRSRTFTDLMRFPLIEGVWEPGEQLGRCGLAYALLRHASGEDILGRTDERERLPARVGIGTPSHEHPLQPVTRKGPIPRHCKLPFAHGLTGGVIWDDAYR